MKSIKYFLFLVYLVCFVPLTAQNIISGKVFLDKNGRISDERFTELSADYEAEQRELKEPGLSFP